MWGNKRCYKMNENFDIVILRDTTGDDSTDAKREEFKASITHF
jgi:hypothetical protein